MGGCLPASRRRPFLPASAAVRAARLDRLDRRAVALSQPLGSLLIISVLAVFYGATSEGWSGKWNRHQEGSWS